MGKDIGAERQAHSYLIERYFWHQCGKYIGKRAGADRDGPTGKLKQALPPQVMSECSCCDTITCETRTNLTNERSRAQRRTDCTIPLMRSPRIQLYISARRWDDRFRNSSHIEVYGPGGGQARRPAGRTLFSSISPPTFSR